jgi:hypothetical protein
MITVARSLPVQKIVLICLFLGLPAILTAQVLQERPRQAQPVIQTARALANNDAVYLALRNIRTGPEAISVSGFRFKRDAGIFTFRSGTFYLLQPVNGKITGAVFFGDGAFGLTPPVESERRYLKFLAKDEFVEHFSEAVFRFTDETEQEIRKAEVKDAAASAGNPDDLLHEVQQELKKRLKENLDARLLQDVLSSRPGGKFCAFIKGKRYGGKLIYDIDPQGVVSYVPDPPPIFRAGPRISRHFSLTPEEVALTAWDENHYGIWTAFHLSSEYAAGTASSGENNLPFNIQHQKLDAQIEKSGRLSGLAETTFTASRDGVRVLAFDLFPTLRVDWVAGSDGQPLPFIQEGIEEDSDFSVILPRELKKDESYTIITKYSGKDAITNENNGNYYPLARENWYPSQGLGHYATYEMTFRVPKGMKLASTGQPLRTVNEGKETVSEWKSEAPQAVAGFNFGEFRTQQSRDLGNNYDVETDVNAESPDIVEYLRSGPYSGAVGTLSTVSMMKKATAEAQVALDLYTDYFGEQPYKRLAMTQQTALNYGQSWPGLVFLPISYFFDSTARHFIGFGNDHGFFKSVGPHEIAHQWWGHTVGWNSYRDQWMSEGFAECSASIFLQLIYRDHGLDDYHEFWAEQRKLLTETNTQGRRAVDVGPLTLGYRLSTAKTGFDVTRNLIYPKGAFILQMVRFMLQDNSVKDVDGRFKALMHDFTATYASRPATTEDFKAMLEKHMTREMDLTGNHTMDWFFNQYVYGTEYPHYKFEHSFSTDTDGTPLLNLKLTQSRVSENFVSLVPVYIQLGKGNVVRLGRASVRGNTSLERHIRLKGVQQKPERALIAYYDDLLGDIENK